MKRYIARRLVSLIPIMVLVSMFTFLGQQLVPGDPINTIIGTSEERQLDPQIIQEIRREYGLDQPIPIQYVKSMWKVMHGDFGRSFQTKQPVTGEISARLPITLTLGVTTLLLNTSIALVLGTLAGVHRGTIMDFLATSWAVLGAALPGFWVAIVLIIVFAANLGWLPASGWVSPYQHPVAGIRHMLLPVIALGLFGSAAIMRQTRSSLVEVLNQDYIRTARAKGLKERTVVTRHALKNGLIPVVTVLGFSLAHVIGGSVLIERVFALPGVGRLALDATNNRDYPVVQAIVLMSAAAVVFANLVSDVMYFYLDPRIRY